MDPNSAWPGNSFDSFCQVEGDKNIYGLWYFCFNNNGAAYFKMP
jgi:hypothetical protein